MKKHWIAFILVALLKVDLAQALIDGSGWMRVSYLNRILIENRIRFKQLQTMIQNAQTETQYLKMIHDGVHGVTGLMQMLPVQDNKVLGEIRNFKEALRLIKNVYGMIPKSREAPLQRLHDESVAESLRMVNKSKSYAGKQEENAVKVFHAGEQASSKGAVRMTAQMNAQILHSLNQLIKVNAQILKLISGNMAYQNKEGKQGAKNFNKVKRDMKAAWVRFKGDFKMPRF